MGLITVVAIAVMVTGEKLFSSERLEGVVSVLFGTAALATGVLFALVVLMSGFQF